MSENFSNSNSGKSNRSLNTNEIFARLRGISISPKTETPASPVYLAGQSGEGQFSRDFMQYRSLLQKKLKEDIPGVQNSSMGHVRRPSTVSPTASAASIRFSALNPGPVRGSAVIPQGSMLVSQTAPSASIANSVQRTENRVSIYPANVQNSEVAARLSASLNGSAGCPASVPAMGFQNQPYAPQNFRTCENQTVQAFQQTAPQAELQTNVLPETQPAASEVPAPVQTKRTDEELTSKNNPFARLASRDSAYSENASAKSSTPASEFSNLNGWLSSICCFGILGIVTGTAFTIFGLNSTASAAHQFTALGFSLLISGTAMFTFLGITQGFRSQTKNV